MAFKKGPKKGKITHPCGRPAKNYKTVAQVQSRIEQVEGYMEGQEGVALNNLKLEMKALKARLRILEEK